MRLVIRAATVVAATMLCGAVSVAQQPQDTTAAKQQRTLDSLTAVVRALQARMDSAEAAGGATVVPDTANLTPAETPAAAPPRSGAYMNVGFVSQTDAGWSTAKDVRALQPGDHDPHVRGFTMPNSEISLDGAVDPYFKGFANIVYKIDEAGETGVELEEAFLITTSLPHNLQLKVGQFFTEFGRQNAQHPHSWGFVDLPIALHRMFGADGLRSQGARLSWLLPTPFYAEGLITIANSGGETLTSFRSEDSPAIHGGFPNERPVNTARDLLIAPRLATSMELSETQTLLLGASAAFGPNNAGPKTQTQIYGVDAYYKWKPATAQAGFPFISVQAEGLYRRYEVADRESANGPDILNRGFLIDQGAYAQLLYGIKPRIIAGLRGDFADGDHTSFVSELRADRFRISPNLTWYPTEFSKIRLQYNYDDRQDIGIDHSIWMQFEFLLGAHASHKF